jgi:hypothetical protein
MLNIERQIAIDAWRQAWRERRRNESDETIQAALVAYGKACAYATPDELWQAAQPTEDETVFGADAWVYCSQHVKPHQTGWCSVSVRDKIGLGVDNAQAAYEKCRAFGLKIYGEE